MFRKKLSKAIHAWLDRKFFRGVINESISIIRDEFTVMPRFLYHQPLDYQAVTLPIKEVRLDGPHMPIPSGDFRFGYAVDNDEEYLRWGQYDFELVLEQIKAANLYKDRISILDFGCSSGRVLRHFEHLSRVKDWKLYGCDIQARAVESMRADNWPKPFQIFTNSIYPHLPLEDNSLDVIYSFSVFTHIKYLWDAWLLELRRVLKNDGVMIHTVHLEEAWSYYHENRQQNWVQLAHTPHVYSKPQMDVDFLFFGDASVSQSFYTKRVLEKYWGRYFSDIKILPPSKEFSFQNRVILRK